MTPEQTLSAYRPLVEEFEQAPALLMLDDGDGLSIVELKIEIGAADAIENAWQQLRHGIPTPRIATFVGEGWLRAIKLGSGGDEHLNEAVMAVQVGEESWLVQQVFARTRDGVRWEEPLMVPVELDDGDVHVVLQKIVSGS